LECNCTGFDSGKSSSTSVAGAEDRALADCFGLGGRLRFELGLLAGGHGTHVDRAVAVGVDDHGGQRGRVGAVGVFDLARDVERDWFQLRLRELLRRHPAVEGEAQVAGHNRDRLLGGGEAGGEKGACDGKNRNRDDATPAPTGL
jgi:hypothetical protein